MEKGWVVAYSFSDSVQAELSKQMLEEHDIACVLINKRDSAYNSFGEIELFVKEDDLLKSRTMLKNLES